MSIVDLVTFSEIDNASPVTLTREDYDDLLKSKDGDFNIFFYGNVFLGKDRLKGRVVEGDDLLEFRKLYGGKYSQAISTMKKNIENAIRDAKDTRSGTKTLPKVFFKFTDFDKFIDCSASAMYSDVLNIYTNRDSLRDKLDEIKRILSIKRIVTQYKSENDQKWIFVTRGDKRAPSAASSPTIEKERTTLTDEMLDWLDSDRPKLKLSVRRGKIKYEALANTFKTNAYRKEFAAYQKKFITKVEEFNTHQDENINAQRKKFKKYQEYKREHPEYRHMRPDSVNFEQIATDKMKSIMKQMDALKIVPGVNESDPTESDEENIESDSEEEDSTDEDSNVSAPSENSVRDDPEPDDEPPVVDVPDVRENMPARIRLTPIDKNLNIPDDPYLAQILADQAYANRLMII